MNRQAFTFLTLFSLVLMLTIYYVTLPVDDTSQLDPDKLIAAVEQTTLDSYDELLAALNQKREVLKERYNAVLASSESTEAAKHEALSALNELQTLRLNETAIESALNEAGYDGCFAEISDEVIKLTCAKKYKNAEDAAKIIASVERTQSGEMSVEVSFE